MGQKFFTFNNYPFIYKTKLIPFIIFVALYITFLFCMLSLKGFATVQETQEKSAEVKTEKTAAKGEALQVEKYPQGRLHFNIYWLGIYAGNAVLEASNDNGTLRIISRVYSAPFISIFYKVEDYAECVIRDGIPFNFRIKQHEGKYRSDKETKFKYAKRKLVYFDYLKGKQRRHTIKEGIVWDVISGFYYLMAQPLEIGKVIYIDIFDSNKFYKAEVSVLRKEDIEVLDRGKVNTVVVNPKLQSEGLFQSRGDILVWLTDDEQRIPVRVETKVPIGKVVVKLIKIEMGKGIK